MPAKLRGASLPPTVVYLHSYGFIDSSSPWSGKSYSCFVVLSRLLLAVLLS